MIKTRSNYYISVPWIHPTDLDIQENYTLKVFVWSGDVASVPGSEEYEIKKYNATTSNGTEKVNIGRLLNDYIEFSTIRSSSTQLLDNGTNSMFYKVEVFYEDDVSPEITETGLFIQGYGRGNEGENPQPPTNKVYIPNREYKVGTETVFTIPVETDSTAIDYTIISHPNNTINVTGSTPVNSTDNSTTYIKYINVDVSEAINESYIEVIYNSVSTTLYIEPEYIYTPYDIYFQNKQGHQQTLTFFKERTNSLNTAVQSFESDRGQPSLGNHQSIEFDKNGKTTLKLSTGFIDENINEDIRQLMLSERVWIYENDLMTPINVKQRNITYKNRLNDRLVNYAIDFEYSFNEINTI